MSCYTEIEILEDTSVNRRARKKLGLAEEGPLDFYVAQRVRREAGIIKAYDAIRRLQPTAVIRRTGDKLQVTVQA